MNNKIKHKLLIFDKANAGEIVLIVMAGVIARERAKEFRAYRWLRRRGKSARQASKGMGRVSKCLKRPTFVPA